MKKSSRWILSLLAICLVTLSLVGLLHSRRYQRPYLTVIGFAEMSDGLGRQAVEIIDTLKDDVKVGYRATTPPLYQDVPIAVQNIMKKNYKRLGKIILYEDILHPLSHLFFQRRFQLHAQDELRLAYSMFESSEIPKTWVYDLNLYFDAVLVPDEFLVDVYKNSGITVPIFVLPLGLNLKPFLNLPLKTEAHTPFVFANFGTGIERKNHLALIQAFYTAFGNQPDVRLWINCKYSRENLFTSLEQEVEKLGVSNIVLTNNCYTHAEYLKNFQEIDCYVSLSEAEGFSIQPREAMALGIPCIVSDNTAQSTICKSGIILPVLSTLQVPAYYEQFQEILGFRYHVDFDQSVLALQAMYKNYAYYLTFSEAMREWARSYDYENLKPLYRSLVLPKKVILDATNSITPTCITTTSPYLYNKYKAVLCKKRF